MWGTAVCGALALVWSVALTVTDLRERRLPDRLTVPAAALVWMLCPVTGHPWALAGALGWWALCVVPGKVTRRLRTGGGDAKLALSLGGIVAAVGGLPGWWLAVAASSVLTLCLVPVLRSPTGTLPHGPGMLGASWLAVIFPGFLTM